MLSPVETHERGQQMRVHTIVALLVGLSLSACGDPPGPSSVDLVGATGARVRVTTTGLDINPNGYRVAVDGSERGAIAANGTTLIQLDPGPRTIALTGLTPNCELVNSGSRTVDIVAAEVAQVEFAVACAATSGVIRVVLSASEFGARALFGAMVDGGTPIPATQSLPAYLGGVRAGDHIVSLRAPAGCSVDSASQPATVTAGGLVRDTVEVSFSVTCAKIPALIAFVRRLQTGPDGMPGPPNIYLANSDGSEAMRLTSGEQPAWSPDGRRMAFNRGGMIHVADPDGSNQRQLRPGGYPAWSPDGTRIVFHTAVGDAEGGIFVVNADGSRITRLIENDFAHPGSHDWTGWPEWSPDGRISFVLAPDYDSYEPWQIFVMNADGSEPRKLNILVDGAFAGVHSWSPSGSRMAFGFLQGLYWTIASVNSSGADFRIHYPDDGGGFAGDPDWSPDGRSLVFEKYVTTSGCQLPSCPKRIFVVSAEGGPARQLIPDVEGAPEYWDEEPAWSRATD